MVLLLNVLNANKVITLQLVNSVVRMESIVLIKLQKLMEQLRIVESLVQVLIIVWNVMKMQH